MVCSADGRSRCENNGRCTPDGATYTCNCPRGFEGELCGINTNDCASQPCAHGGICIDGVRGYRCECMDAFTGDNCRLEVVKPPPPPPPAPPPPVEEPAELTCENRYDDGVNS